MAAETRTVKDLVEYIVKSLVDHPDDVEVAEISEQGGITLELSVAAPDMGRVIGKSGRVINAIRSLLQVASAKQGVQVTLELLEADERR